MNRFNSAAFLAALTLAVATPTFAVDMDIGANTPEPDADTVIPGAKAVDEVSGGAIVDPDGALKRGAIKKNQSTKQPCKKPTTTQSTNSGEAPCEPTDKNGQTTPAQGK